jgi:hypothetical protein
MRYEWRKLEVAICDFKFGTCSRRRHSAAAGRVSGNGRAALKSQIVILKPGRHAKYLPHAFTEHGAMMLLAGAGFAAGLFRI